MASGGPGQFCNRGLGEVVLVDPVALIPWNGVLALFGSTRTLSCFVRPFLVVGLFARRPREGEA